MKRLLFLLTLTVVVCAGAAARVLTGVEVTRKEGFSLLRGKRIGLVTNPTGVDNEMKSTVDILAEADDVRLVALFAPEHGVRGDVPAGKSVDTYSDAKTGITVYSLYGATKKPSARMLGGLDAVVYDIQDIGCRSYTFISTLGKLMEACVENNKELIVFDRPNPLGGNRVEGPFGVDPDCKSFVSQYSIPYIYGLTPGEFARYLNDSEFGGRCKLLVIKMEGWTRTMSFCDTGLRWVPTSPNIPTAETVLYYPALGILGELGPVNIGANYTMPFRVAVSGKIDAERLCNRLRLMSLPGVTFRPCHLTVAGSALHGVEVYLSPQTPDLTMVQFCVMEALAAEGLNPLDGAAPSRVTMFDRVCGSKAVRRVFSEGNRASDVRTLVSGDNAAVKDWRDTVAPYLLY